LHTTSQQYLPRRDILKKRSDIRSVLACGPTTSGALRGYFHAGQNRRAAFFIPQRIGKAVVRNKQKRRMREAYRQMKDKFPQGDAIFKLLRRAEWDGLYRDFAALAVRLRTDCDA
jgi:ribonuclease P protein component